MVSNKVFRFPHANFIGFDHIWNEIEKLSQLTDNTYPPHNVVKYSDTKFAIELALAGYKKEDLEVEIKEGVLFVRGGKSDTDETIYLHKGISAKKFVRSFRLSEHVVVEGADFVDGLLVIDLKVIVPEESRPRLIQIN